MAANGNTESTTGVNGTGRSAGTLPEAARDSVETPVVALSLIFPIYNEEEVLPALLARLDALIPRLETEVGPVEVICVNDGSRDRSFPMLIEATQTRPWLKALSMSRNFGHQIAVTCGMDHTRGQAVAVLDADLQDPPELLLDMVRLWREGADMVYAVRTRREGESAFKLWTAGLFYRLLRRLTAVDIPADAGDFRLMDRKVVDAMNAMGESHRFLRGMAAWVGFNQVPLPYERPARAAGETKYPLRKMLRLAADAVCSFSDAPLKLAMSLGWTIAGLSILFGITVVVRALFHDPTLEKGWSSLIVVISFLSGVQLITLGLVGEYIGRIYDEAKGRPLYLIGRAVNFDEPVPTVPTRTFRR